MLPQAEGSDNGFDSVVVTGDAMNNFPEPLTLTHSPQGSAARLVFAALGRTKKDFKFFINFLAFGAPAMTRIRKSL